MNRSTNRKEKYTDNRLAYHSSADTIDYFWSFGFLAGLCLFVQIISRIFMAMYVSLMLSTHFYLWSMLCEMFRMAYFSGICHARVVHLFCGLPPHVPKSLLRLSCMLIYRLMLATGFLGYVLSWGQMSFWGATVITNLFSIVPFVGPDLVQWLWGGFCVNNTTLNKFFVRISYYLLSLWP